MIHFTLYSRSWCHLCDDMLQALHRHGESHRFTVDVIDIDLDESLVARYDELVPVLVGTRNGGQPRQLCHYFLDENSLNAFLAE